MALVYQGPAAFALDPFRQAQTSPRRSGGISSLARAKNNERIFGSAS
jgi:hypothetical protein